MKEQTAMEEKIVNGVSVTNLLGTIDAIGQQPDIAKFNFRAKNKWIGGSKNRTSVNEFYGACETHKRETDFVMEKDEAVVLLGQDSAPNPVEYVLAGLAGCLTTGLVYHAAARGIEIDEIESTYEGDINLHGFLGLSDSYRNGFEGINVTFKIKSDAPREQIEELIRIAQERSPVFDIVANPVPVRVKLAE